MSVKTDKKLSAAIDAAQNGKTEEARKKFEELLEEAGSEVQVAYNAGIFFSGQGEHLLASECLNTAAENKGSDPDFLVRAALEDYHIGGGEVFDTDFMAFDPHYLVSAKEKLQKALESNPDNPEWKNLLEKVEATTALNRMAFKFANGELDYCRRAVSRKKEMTVLDERVMGFLNLLDSGEYEYVQGKFGVTLRSDLPKESGPGFLDRIRNYMLGK